MINRVLGAGERILSQLQRGLSSILEIDAELVAFGPSRLTDDEKMIVRRTVWTSQFLELVVQYIRGKKENWKVLYVAIGNTTAFAVLDVIERVLESNSLLDLLFQHVNANSITHTHLIDESLFNDPLEIALAHLEQENDEKTIATWIIANLVQSMDGNISDKIYRFIPPLSQIITKFLNVSNISLSKSLSEQELTVLFSDKQTEFRSFRALAGLFSIRMTRLNFPLEYNDFIQQIQQFPLLIRSILYEYSLGLDGIVIPGTQFYPDAYQRALTISFLTKIPECQEILLDNHVISLLTRSLWTKYLDSDLQTSLLWKRSLNSLYNLSFSCRERHALFRQDEDIDGLLWVAGWNKDKDQLISWTDRQIAAEVGSILHLKEVWEIERLFWITQRKKQKDCCFLVLLPEALIKVIMKWLILFSSSDEQSGRVREIYNGYNKRNKK